MAVILGKKPNKNLKPFYDSLPGEFDHFARRGTLLVAARVEHVLWGFNFDPAVADPNLRWLSWFVQLLCDPFDCVSLSFGSRIPITQRWGVRQPPMPLYHEYDGYTPQDTIRVMLEEGLPNLKRCNTIQGLYELSLDFSVDYLDLAHYWRYITAASCAMLMDRSLEDVRCHLEQVRLAMPNWRGPEPHEVEMLQRTDQLERVLDCEGRTAALRMLKEWEEWSVAQLRIEDIYDGSSWTDLLK